MKKSIFILFYSLTIYSYAQSNLQGREWQSPGNCTDYLVEGNKVIFHCENNAKVSLELLSQGIVKIWYTQEGKFEQKNKSFAVVNENLEEVGSIQVNEQKQTYEIFTGFLRIRVNKAPFQLQIFDKYQKLLMSDYKDKGLAKDGERILSYKSLRNDEQIFGLGEKAGPLNKRGKTYTMWNSDVPCYSPNQDPLYKSIPFFMSSYRYGIFFDNTYKTTFRFGTESEEYYSFEAPGGEMIYYFIYGKDYKEIIEQYTRLTGKPIMPPKWAFGFSQSRGLYVHEQQALDIAAEFRKRRIPNDIIYQDIGWTQYLQDFNWRHGNYKNPQKMVKVLSDSGFKMIVSQDPVISQANKKQWKEADSLGYLTIDTRTGQSYDMPWPWGGNCGVVDFTKPEVADWWGAYQQKVLDDGVKGFWTDMGEPAWSNEDATDRLFMKHHLGMHDEIHNVYGLTWDKVVKEQFEKHNPGKRVFQMTRAAYAGLQRYTFGWSGDAGNGSNVLDGWNQLANQIPMSLSAGMGLIPFWATDISGYCGDIHDYPSMKELYVRWLQFGLFNPLSRAHHEGDNAVEPWLFGEDAESIARTSIELKYQLFPYFYTYAREAHDTGIPLMRAMLLEFPNDEETYKTDHQFMLGKELLVAPVVKKGARTKEVYLPEGEWIDFSNPSKTFQGNQWVNYKAPLEVTPLFVKKGSIVPLMPVMQYIHEKADYPIHFKVFPAAEGQQAVFELYEDDGETTDYLENIYSKTSIIATTKKEGYEVTVDDREAKGYRPAAERNFLIQLYVDKKPKKVQAKATKVKEESLASLQGKTESDFNTIIWAWDKVNNICLIKMPDTGKKVVIEIVK